MKNKNGIDLLTIKNTNEELQDNINILNNNIEQNNINNIQKNNKYQDFKKYLNNFKEHSLYEAYLIGSKFPETIDCKVVSYSLNNTRKSILDFSPKSKIDFSSISAHIPT